VILRFYRKSHFQHLAQNVGYLNALTVPFALDPPLQIGRNVDVQRFLLRHSTVTNPAVYRIDMTVSWTGNRRFDERCPSRNPFEMTEAAKR
jgi:hypothetical protein